MTHAQSDLPAGLWPASLGTPEPSLLQQQTAQIRPALEQALATLKIDTLPANALPGLYLPLAHWVKNQITSGRPLILGINGAQGSGKSTLCELLKVILETGFGLRVAGLSIDDLYLTHEQRRQLGQSIHPLLVTRGVPGTHDVELGLSVIDSLSGAGTDDVTAIPSFDKSTDDRRPEQDWPEFTGRPDVIILEGWCVGCIAQPEQDLSTPINSLESTEDADQAWRQYVNRQLQEQYTALFNRLDCLIMLKVPSMESVFEWRSLQERKLAEKTAEITTGGSPQPKGIMSEAALQRFIMHYERLTRHTLDEMPQRANLTLVLNQDHQISQVLHRP